MRLLIGVFVAGVAVGTTLAAPTAQAAPDTFPDLDAMPAADPAGYWHNGGHPSNSGWTFSTAGGVRCQDNFVAQLGVFCEGFSPTGHSFASASVTDAGRISTSGTDIGGDFGHYPLLGTGQRITTDNGVTCAVISDEEIACRAMKPASWGPDVANPPNQVYSEHGFVFVPGPPVTATTY